MGVYLTQLRSVINDVQSKHITNILKSEKNTGQIKNLEDFRARLSQLTAQILADQVSPSLTLFFAQLNEIIDSTSYNFMLDRVRDDLEAIYAELNTLDEIIDAHNNIINNVVLKSIKFGISELENKVQFYEFLANNPNGFSKSIISTFSGSTNNRTFRTDTQSNVLFLDPVSNIPIESDVTVDTVAQKITLGPSSTFKYIPIKSIAQIFDAEALQTESLVSSNTSNINNVIDGSNGTYWTYSILQKELIPNGIIAKLQLDLGVQQEINFIEIEAASIYPMVFKKLQYLNTSNTYVDINFNEIISNRSIGIGFEKIITSKIIVQMQQFNAAEVQYENKNNTDIFGTAVLSDPATPDTDAISNLIRSNVTSSKLLENAFMISQKQNPNEQVRFYDYIIGFDNIRIGFANFVDKSIFVSSQIDISNLKQIALKANDSRPLLTAGTVTSTTDTNPNSDVGFFMGSIEYNIILQNYNVNNELIDINLLPILPESTTYINHERLILSKTIGPSNIPNTGMLRFYTLHFNDTQLNAIKVYRNGTLLTRDIDWIIEDTFPYTNDLIPPNGNKNSVAIRIIHPNLSDIFTVSYSPLFSNTFVHSSNLDNVDIEFSNNGGIKVIDILGDGSITIDNNSIINIHSQKHHGQNIAHSKVNLSIIFRNNAFSLDISPAVSSYTLLLNDGSING